MAELSDTIVTTKKSMENEVSNALFDVAWGELDRAVRKAVALASVLSPDAESQGIAEYGRDVFVYAEAQELALMLREIQKGIGSRRS